MKKRHSWEQIFSGNKCMNKKNAEYVDRGSPAQHMLWKDRQPLISHLDLELTERCNNNCVHCSINLPEKDRRAQSKELTISQWEGILKQAADLGVLSVRFTGGEPLLRPDFVDIYLIARKLGLKVLLFTNARLIDARLARLFAGIPLLEKIEVSVYGMHRKTYEAVSRISGSFTQYQRGIRFLEEYRIPFVVKGILLPNNAKDVQEIECWAKSLPGMDRPPDFCQFLELRARRDSQQKNRKIQKLRISPELGLAFYLRHEHKIDQSLAQYCANFVGIKGDSLFACCSGEGGCVDAYGRWQHCLSLRHPDFSYDLLKGSLREALNQKFSCFRTKKSKDLEFLNRCARCFLMGLCEQCPGRSWNEHGTLDTPVEYLCLLAHLWACHLGLLSKGEQAWKVLDGRQRISELVKQIKIDPERTQTNSADNRVKKGD